MTVEQFWAINEAIQSRHAQDLDDMYELLYRKLEQLETEELVHWSLILEEYYRACCQQKLHDILVEQYGVEEADDFCGWLLMQGRKECKRILGNPEPPLDLLERYDTAFGDITTIAPSVYLAQEGIQEWDLERFRAVQSRYPLSEEVLRDIYKGVIEKGGRPWKSSCLPPVLRPDE